MTMFITDNRLGFYDDLLGERVLVLVNLDVDSLCACKILQHLFQCDGISFSIIPVGGKDDLTNAFNDIKSDQVKKVILLNCGGTLDLLDFLEPPDDVIFYVADSHRPLDLANIYDAEQVKIITPYEEDASIPEFSKLFRDDDSESDAGDDDADADEEDGYRQTKRRRFDERTLEKQRERRLWEDNREKIVFDYSKFSYHDSSIAVLMYELAWKMSKESNDLLWLAVIGSTEQFISGRVHLDKYIATCDNLQQHVLRLNRGSTEDGLKSVHFLKLSQEKDLSLVLYRHWSLFESLRHSCEIACKFKLWTLRGEKKLNEFLADLGMPLTQCKQKFVAMDVQLRKGVKKWMEDKSTKYGLDNLMAKTFLAQYGYNNNFCAADVAYATLGLLEFGINQSKSRSDCFLEGLDCLSRSKLDKLLGGLELARNQMSAIFKQVQGILNMRQVISAGPFLFTVIQEGTPNAMLFNSPGALTALARFLLNAYASTCRNKKRAYSLPLVLSGPTNPETNTNLIVGIPPLDDDTCKNLFGKAFEQATTRAKSRCKMDYFDSNIIEINADDRSKFFDCLTILLS